MIDLPVRPDNCRPWVYFRQYSMRHELDFVLLANLDEFDWQWSDLCEEVGDKGFVILED